MTDREILEKAIQKAMDYSITSNGKVYSYKSGHRQQLKFSHKNGYRVVGLTVHGKTEDHYVHRLVATTFIKNPESYSTVNHIDGDKSNNDVSNLEWCTHKQNMRHAWKTGLLPHPPTHYGEDAGSSKLTAEQVIEIRQRHVKGETNVSIAKDFLVHHGTIARVVNNLTWRQLSDNPIQYLGKSLGYNKTTT